ncbi:MAG: CDP-alcohol phosphatidyltransferase family protein [Bacteroidales bacterium]|nr:CDP-alcohol phosphatidyltransferase family protein [Bacteroidales bacterium]MDT8431952.1 CDP-alcohol phosphatidyltransferase family protein [Bacteroidales bacterium]
MKKNIPNLLTILNLVSGSLALYLVLNGQPAAALWFFTASVFFDFADGMAARLLKATSAIGKQLDSLADLVSFGLVPAAMIFMVLRQIIAPGPGSMTGDMSTAHKVILLTVLIVPAFAALRLARFNTFPSMDHFIGLPTPAFALFWTGIYYDYSMHQAFFGQSVNVWFIWGVMVLMSLMMLVPLPMLALKFSNYKLFPNFSKYLLLVVSVVILIFTGIPGLPLVILTYILLSLVRILLT